MALLPNNTISKVHPTFYPLTQNAKLKGVRDKGQLKPGQTVLINGASGGVGSYAVQIAKSFGATVTGVCSTKNMDLVRSLGADHVIDYAKEDFTQTGRTYDLMLDIVGNRTATDYQRALAPKGRCVLIGFSTVSHMFKLIALGAWISRRGAQQITPMNAEISQANLMHLASMIEDGSIKPVIDRCYAFEELPQGIQYLETGRARGKVVIEVE